MNYKQEEHKIRLFSPSSPYRDSFTGIWTSIARRQHFLKLTLSTSPSTSPLAGGRSIQEEINHAIRQRDGSISPYTSQVFQTYRIVYQKGQTVIVTNQQSSIIGTFFAVEDTDCPHRYFIAFAFSVGPMTESITGIIAYFNEKGHCYSDRTIVCEDVLATYDMRNGIIREGQMFFYHQSLLFTQVHRDTRRLLLTLNYVPYDTEDITDHTTYHTRYTIPYYGAVWGESITLFKRFLHVPLSDTTLLFDLGSLNRVKERICRIGEIDYTTQLYFTLQSYHLPNKDHMLPFLEVATLFPEKEYSDGYPLHCIKCHANTVSASYGYKSPYHSSAHPSTYFSTHTRLGNSYCPDCRIRYSNSKRQWLCAEICLDGSICDGCLLETGCRSASSHSSDQTVILLYDAPLLKYPYRQRIQIQWAPLEDAAACAHVSRLMAVYSTTEMDRRPPKEEDDLLDN